MLLSIATWNSRGNPANDNDKLAVLNCLFREHRIILIQECGGLSRSNLPPGASIIASDHVGAYHNRCNSCIISDQLLQNVGSFTLPSSNGRACTYGNYGQGLIVGTLHANAHYDAAHDAAGALAQLSHEFPNMPVILGGDFNAEPIDLSTGRTRSKLVGTTSRGVGFHIASPGVSTHTSGRTLDFFVLNSQLISKNTRTHFTNGGSDHKPVMTAVAQRLCGG